MTYSREVEAAIGTAELSDLAVDYVKAPDYGGKPSYWGLFRFRGEPMWHRVCNRNGDPISYTTPQTAEAGATEMIRRE